MCFSSSLPIGTDSSEDEHGDESQKMELGLKRKIEKGIISEEEAKPKFIRGDSSTSMQETKKAEEGNVSEEEAKSKFIRGVSSYSMQETKKLFGDLDSLVEAVKAEETKHRKKKFFCGPSSSSMQETWD